MGTITKRREDRKLLVIFSDMQSGHKLGLLNPDVVFSEKDEEGNPVSWQPRPTAIQDYLWELFSGHVVDIRDLADGSPIVLIHNGDLTHGDKHKAILVSNRIADQFLIATANFAPFLELPNLEAIRLTSGTPAHTFLFDTAPILVSELLCKARPGLDVRVIHHGLLDIEGVLTDYAHHGPSPGIREWTSGNQLRYYATSCVSEHLRWGRSVPRLIVRSHYHDYRRETVYRQHVKEGGRVIEKATDIIVTPSYSGLTEHGRQVTRSIHWLVNGLVAVEIENGKLREVYPLCGMIDLRTKEAL